MAKKLVASVFQEYHYFLGFSNSLCLELVESYIPLNKTKWKHLSASFFWVDLEGFGILHFILFSIWNVIVGSNKVKRHSLHHNNNNIPFKLGNLYILTNLFPTKERWLNVIYQTILNHVIKKILQLWLYGDQWQFLFQPCRCGLKLT